MIESDTILDCPECSSEDYEKLDEHEYLCKTCHTTFTSDGTIIDQPTALVEEPDDEA